jgi:uncharacterized repeat protein (TIGR03803 family)
VHRKGVLLFGCFAAVLVSYPICSAQIPGNAAPSHYKERVLHRFAGDKRGGAPFAGVTFDSSGNLYGTTTQGGVAGYGTVFELTHSETGWKETVLHSFKGADGDYPNAGSLVFDRAGNIYGTTAYGGAYGFGTVYELTKRSNNTWAERVLHSFRGVGNGDGQYPEAGIIFDSKGNLYGTTNLGGREAYGCPGNGCGTVFKLTPSGSHWKETLLYTFRGNEDGAGVNAPLIFDTAGSLYGTTAEGGTGNQGIIFELTQANGVWKERVLHRFTGGSDGGGPYAGLTFHGTGHIYGSTFYGGTSGYGTVFELSHLKTGWEETVLFNFDAGSDGGFPYYGTLKFDKTGNIYGTTQAGGCCGFGTVFELSPGGDGKWTETVLDGFVGDGDDGVQPVGGVVFDAAGNLYGTTSGGGNLGTCSDTVSGCGVVFELTPQ